MTEAQHDEWAPGASNAEDEGSEKDDDSVLSGSEPLIGAAAGGGRLGVPDPPQDSTGSTSTGTDRGRNGQNQKRDDSSATVGWGDLPQKKQLIVITLARLSEPLVQTSLQSYMFYQLKWFDPTLPDSVIAGQAGILHSSFTAAQFLTAMMWGRIADSRHFGRKTVLLIGLSGTMLSCIGFGFSTSFAQALFFRALGGITNGNIGVLRTMISEIIKEKKYQSRAFLLLPMTFNIGVIIGPVLGGILSDPAGSYPSLFGNVKFFVDYPYATPNLVSAFFLFLATISVWMALKETLDSRRERRDIGVELGTKLTRVLGACFSRGKPSAVYAPLPSRDSSIDIEMSSSPASTRPSTSYTPAAPTAPGHKLPARPRYTRRLPFRRIFTRNVSFTLLAHFFMAFHVGTFNALWFVFLSTPVYDPAKPPPAALPRRLPFFFTGGLGLRPREVGVAMAILGVLGICMQIFLYPTLSARLGTVRSWRLALLFFPVTYFLVPYLSLVPSSAASPPPAPKDGFAVWLAVAGVLFCQVVGRTFALPAQTILVNNCTPHPSVLGTVHGIGQSVSSFARTVGPVLCGFLYGLGLANGIVGAVFWGLSGVAICGVLASWWVREGNGHEIWLDGDAEDNELR